MHVSEPSLQTERSFAIAGNNSCTLQADPLRDKRLAARVKEALLDARDVTAKEILIEAADGVVCLSGSVDSEAMKQATLAAARMVCGPRNVVDQLVLREALRNALTRRKKRRYRTPTRQDLSDRRSQRPPA